ncbi:MAG: hypothetical protein Ct9H300mP1_36130 [Planctomycetaceae bacterium]|nr:MAG: hypothetical protein Ct9H300mP1_36130 [Planctomycetaceae bacterium]
MLAIHGLNVNPESTDMLIAAKSARATEHGTGHRQTGDLDAFYRFWAIEGLLGFWDGYSANPGKTFSLPQSPFRQVPFHALGHRLPVREVQQTEGRSPRPVSVKTMGLGAHKLYQVPAARERYRRTLRDIMDKHWDEEACLPRLIESRP